MMILIVMIRITIIMIMIMIMMRNAGYLGCELRKRVRKSLLGVPIKPEDDHNYHDNDNDSKVWRFLL